MSLFPLPTLATAPTASRQTLQNLTEHFGYLPNVLASMAANPVLLNGFAGAFGAFHGGSFDAGERQVLLLTNAVELKCPWTIAAHSTFALEDGLSRETVDALRAGRLPEQPSLAALATLARQVIATRGLVDEAQVEAFTAAGYTKEQLFEVILSVGLSTITAAVTHAAKTPIEARFQAQVWHEAH